MSHPFIFLCPSCGAEDAIQKKNCTVCGKKLFISKNSLGIDGERISYPSLLDRMKKTISLRQPEENITSYLSDSMVSLPEKAWRVSQWSTLFQGKKNLKFFGYKNIFFREIEKSVKLAHGRLIILQNSFFFESKTGLKIFALKDLTCVTTDGRYFVFKIKSQPYYQIKFHHESPLKYEILFQKLLTDFYFPRQIFQFQPSLRFSPTQRQIVSLPISKSKALNANFVEKILKKLLVFLLKIVLSVAADVSISGKENLLHHQTHFVIANHQSAMDPFFILAFLNDKIAFLTKSTSFVKWYEKLFLKLGRGIPTTRYQTDPIVINHIRKILSLGLPIGIFPEGERCWDGKLQNFKLSVVKTLAVFNQPILPISLKNTFGFLPRWRNFPSRQKIEIKVKPPFCLLPGKYEYFEVREFLENLFV